MRKFLQEVLLMKKGRSERGHLVGESHPRAKLSNRDVELLLVLRREGWGYARLAVKFEISKRHVRDLVHGRRRVFYPVAWR